MNIFTNYNFIQSNSIIYRLAKHITYVHQNGRQPDSNTNALDMDFMRRYIQMCKAKDPLIPEELSDFIVGKFFFLKILLKNFIQTIGYVRSL